MLTVLGGAKLPLFESHWTRVLNEVKLLLYATTGMNLRNIMSEKSFTSRERILYNSIYMKF